MKRACLSVAASLSPWSAALAAPAAEPLGAAALMRMTGGLLLVVGLVFATAWAVRRFGRLPNGNSNNLQLLGGVAVGQRERVVLVRAGQQQLVIGVAPGRVQLLHTLQEQVLELPAGGDAAAPAQDQPVTTFQERLLGLLGRGEQR